QQPHPNGGTQQTQRHQIHHHRQIIPTPVRAIWIFGLDFVKFSPFFGLDFSFWFGFCRISSNFRFGF
ncbi:MAG: hypothetical protein PUJ20_04400, partial [Bacteroidales bacterium]|nr:hypothetical protein [Bacteroidales bacterium]MDY4235798.1 hypothetical protein [Sodaliphilus sp.]